MTLSFVSGAPGEVGKRKKPKKTKAEKKAKRKGRRQKVAKIALAPARAAFLAIVSLNVFHLADKLNKGLGIAPQKIKDFWKKFKGSEKALLQAISKGSGKKAPNTKTGEVGSFTIAGAIMTATPILITVTSLLKELKLPTEELDAGIDEGKRAIGESDEFEKGTTEDYLPPDKVGVMQTKPKKDEGADGDEEEGKIHPLVWVLGAGALVMVLSN